MNKNDMTVTMPLKEFERMQKQIEHLKKEEVSNFIKQEYIGDIRDNEYIVVIDSMAILKKVLSEDKWAKGVKII